MVDNKNDNTSAADFLQEIKEYKEEAIVANEPCPEGHRRDPGSGRCLPMGGMDHTAVTRSKNVDYGPEWRGLASTDTDADSQEQAVNADEMEERESCTEGTTFSFIQSKCVTLEDADAEDSDEYAMEEEDAKNGHEEVISNQPDGRKDTVNFSCPPDQFFDHKRRECIPLNKDTVLASEDFDHTFKEEVAISWAKLAITNPDPMDGHVHVATLSPEGKGITSIENGYSRGSYPHSHTVSKFEAAEWEGDEGYVSRHPGVLITKEHRVVDPDDDYSDSPVSCGEEADEKEDAAPIKTEQRNALPDSAFGVPEKRKFPLDTCARVRNAMARFNQAKGLTASEKATLRRKILSRAKACGIEVRNFAKAETEAEFAAMTQELIAEVTNTVKLRVEATYSSDSQQGPCPPGMIWEADERRCSSVRGFVEHTNANHSEIVAKQPEGRRDPVGFKCPDGWFFDFGSRKCLPLDPKMKERSEEEDAESRVLTPDLPGKPARISKDCPPGTIWHGDQKKCLPLDSSKKTKSAEEEDATSCGDDPKKKKPAAKKPAKKAACSEEEEGAEKKKKAKPGGCPPGQFMNPITKKCQEKKSGKPGGKNLPPWLQKKGKGDEEGTEDAAADMSNREGLVPAPAGQVNLPSDCPEGTMWDTSKKTCTPLSTMDKNRPDGSSPQSPKDKASEVENQVENLSLNRLIQHLDAMIREEVVEGRKEKAAKVLAKDLPNAAFPPSLVGSTRRNLMHHTVSVEDPYDNGTVDVSRLRNALARCTSVDGFSDKAVEDACEHLLFHARAIIMDYLAKK